jgi:hypothetical protein
VDGKLTEKDRKTGLVTFEKAEKPYGGRTLERRVSSTLFFKTISLVGDWETGQRSSIMSLGLLKESTSRAEKYKFFSNKNLVFLT